MKESSSQFERFSPLYCAYNGCLLGQFLCLSFQEGARPAYPMRRERIREFLFEIGVDILLPEEPPVAFGDQHASVLEDVINAVAERSRHLADFALLGSLLAQYGVLAREDEAMASAVLEHLEGLRARYRLPALRLEQFRLPAEGGHLDDVLSPSLAYLAEIMTGLDVEAETGFVIMPFKQPYAGYFTQFYRPALEAAGYRAVRAWGGLASEDYCDLLLMLIQKSGLVWVELSELNSNVFYELGAAHAHGKLAVIVVREEDGQTVPANIGHDVISRYAPNAADWPSTAIATLAGLVQQMTMQSSGKRLRGAEVRESVEREISQLEQGEAARDRGYQCLDEDDYVRAERAFQEAIVLGARDASTWLGRGLSRLHLGRPGEAEADFNAALEDFDEAVDVGLIEHDGTEAEARATILGYLEQARSALALQA